MAQLFPRWFGFLFRLGALGAVVIIIAVLLLWRVATAHPTSLHDPLEQPVPFSHKHHVGDDGIDCRYCHTSVEQSAFAGIPPLSTCMTCHSQLFTDQPPLKPLIAAYRSGVPFHWKRLNKLPDFVYFNHSIHIAKGIGCESCHGRIDRMPLTAQVAPLTMQWCLDCHRDPEKNLRPHDEVFSMTWRARDQHALGERLMREYHIDKRRLTDCSTCHR